MQCMYVCMVFYCSSQFSVLKLLIWAAVFAVQKTLIADVLGLRPLSTVTSNGRIGSLNKCFLLDCFAKTVLNKELSFVIYAKKEINTIWVGKRSKLLFQFLIHEKKKRKVLGFSVGGAFYGYGSISVLSFESYYIQKVGGIGSIRVQKQIQS